MARVGAVAEAGCARYTYRLRVSSAARTALAAEWDRCRWVWNECVAKSRAVHLRNKATGQKATCGPAQLDRMLTEARTRTPWLRDGASVLQVSTRLVLMAQDLLERCSRRRPEPGIPSLQGGEDSTQHGRRRRLRRAPRRRPRDHGVAHREKPRLRRWAQS